MPRDRPSAAPQAFGACDRSERRTRSNSGPLALPMKEDHGNRICRNQFAFNPIELAGLRLLSSPEKPL